MSAFPYSPPASPGGRGEGVSGSTSEPAPAARAHSSNFTCFMARRLGCRGPGLRGCPWCRGASRPGTASAETANPLPA